jgi:hypothetical protein
MLSRCMLLPVVIRFRLLDALLRYSSSRYLSRTVTGYFLEGVDANIAKTATIAGGSVDVMHISHCSSSSVL